MKLELTKWVRRYMRARLLRFQLRSRCLYDEFEECRSDDLDSLRTRELMITCYNLIFNQIQKVAEISKGCNKDYLYKQKMIRIPLLAAQVNRLYQGYERGINLCIFAINIEIRGICKLGASCFYIVFFQIERQLS